MSTVPNEYERDLSPEEQALINVRLAAFSAVQIGADPQRVVAEARIGATGATRGIYAAQLPETTND